MGKSVFIISIIAIIVSLAAVILAIFATMRQPNVSVCNCECSKNIPEVAIGFRTAHGDIPPENFGSMLEVVYNEGVGFAVSTIAAHYWWITLTNNGNRTARDIIVEIIFRDGIVFPYEPDHTLFAPFRPILHARGAGVFSGFQWEPHSNAALLPGRAFGVSGIPFETAILCDFTYDEHGEINSFTMEIIIYMDDAAPISEQFIVSINREMQIGRDFFVDWLE